MAATPAKQPVGPLVPLLGYLLRRTHARSMECGTSTLPDRHPSHYAVLAGVEAFGPASQRLLGDRLGISRTTMVQLVDELEDEGLVSRDRDPRDRRSYAVTLTPKGRRLVAELEPAIAAHTACLTRTLTVAERRRLNELLLGLLAVHAGLDALPPKMTERTGFLVARAHFLFAALAREPLASLGIEPQQYGALLLLDEMGPSPQRAVAEAFGVSGTIVVQIADALEDMGLVERRRSPGDRRVHLLTLTRKAHTTLRRARALVEPIGEATAAAVGTEGHVELQRLLAKLLGDPGGD